MDSRLRGNDGGGRRGDRDGLWLTKVRPLLKYGSSVARNGNQAQPRGLRLGVSLETDMVGISSMVRTIELWSFRLESRLCGLKDQSKIGSGTV